MVLVIYKKGIIDLFILELNSILLTALLLQTSPIGRGIHFFSGNVWMLQMLSRNSLSSDLGLTWTVADGTVICSHLSTS